MKTILLFLVLTAIKPCLAQDSTSLPQPQVQKPVKKAIIFAPVNANQNFVIMYLRTTSRKKTWDNFFHYRAAGNKTPAVGCCQLSKTFLSIDQAWLHYNFNAETTRPTVKKLNNVAGELLDTFLSQYSVQNKLNF